ncbi:MAG: hypothetical protein JWO52_7050 [Gammaproteobacteria bacterium]|jgi:hypothetical protein|nr:hypothetical protein [Gammaproteobacteria bacterium]
MRVFAIRARVSRSRQACWALQAAEIARGSVAARCPINWQRRGIGGRQRGTVTWLELQSWRCS